MRRTPAGSYRLVRAARHSGGYHRPIWLHSSRRSISGQLAVREILAAADRRLPDAIICGNDLMAIGAMPELQAAGPRVPADIAVAGFDDIRLGALFAPALTTGPPAPAAAG